MYKHSCEIFENSLCIRNLKRGKIIIGKIILLKMYYKNILWVIVYGTIIWIPENTVFVWFVVVKSFIKCTRVGNITGIMFRRKRELKYSIFFFLRKRYITLCFRGGGGEIKNQFKNFVPIGKLLLHQQRLCIILFFKKNSVYSMTVNKNISDIVC